MASKMTDIVRDNIKSSTTAEFLTSFEWDFEFTRMPDMFGSDGSWKNNYGKLFRLRTNSVVTPEEPVNQPISIEIRGQRFSQPGKVEHSGQFSFALQDFADVALQKPLMQLQYETCNPLTKQMGRHPSQYFFDCKIYQCNSARQPVKVWICKDCLLVACAVTDEMNGEKTPVGQLQVTFTTDIYTVEYVADPASADNKSAYYNNMTL